MGHREDELLVNRFRRLLTRWEKKWTYFAIIHLDCAQITYHQAGIFGKLKCASEVLLVSRGLNMSARPP